MQERKKYRSILDFDFLFVIIIAYFGLLIFNNSLKNYPETNRKPVATGYAFTEKIADTGQGTRILLSDKVLRPGRDISDPHINSIICRGNKTTDVTISCLTIVRYTFIVPPLQVLIHHNSALPDDTEILS